jgi:peptidoglycan/xylan/chitin deacetylase (PgdA/CDA1 family)
MYKKAHGIMFHHFHNEIHPIGQGSIDSNQLDKLIKFVGPENILNARDWYEKTINGTLEDNERCLTFDDNLKCQYDVALPVLEKYGLTAYWFVYSSPLEGAIENLEIYRYFRSKYFEDIDDFYSSFFIELKNSDFNEIYQEKIKDFIPKNYLKKSTFYTDNDRTFRYTRDFILGPDNYNSIMDKMLLKNKIKKEDVQKLLLMNERELISLHDKGHILGLHSHTHPTQLKLMSREEQNLEYNNNFNYLKKITGEAPLTVAHPCNSYNKETIEILKDLGVKLGFRANLDQPEYSALEYPRIDHANLLGYL